MKHNSTDFQKEQLQVIHTVEQQVQNNSLSFSTVQPVDDFERDTRMTLTGVHFLKSDLCGAIDTLVQSLQTLEPEHCYYYYDHASLHTTIKNVHVVSDPPTYTHNDIESACAVFDRVVSRHHVFFAYYFTLILFPASLSLIGTTDPELDRLVLDLDATLRSHGIPDNKVYTNKDHFFSNITLVRFHHQPGEAFTEKVSELQSIISFDPYLVDSVSLVTGNAAMKQLTIINNWQLKPEGDLYGGE
jgi:hypothetical protein